MRNLLMFSIPLLIGNLAQQLYSTADSIIVGISSATTRWLRWAPAGRSSICCWCCYGHFHGCGHHGVQYFGARDRDALSRSIGNALVLVLITGVLMTVAGVALSRPIMEWLDTPVENDVLEMSVTYLTIIFAGIIGPAIYNMVSGILRGMGDSVTPLIFLLIACALNIVLDYLLVAIVPWGVAGAAVATIFSQLVSAVLCVLRLFRMRDAIDLNRRTVRLDMPLTRGC